MPVQNSPAESRGSALWVCMAAGSLALLRPLTALAGGWSWLAPAVCVAAAPGLGRLWRSWQDPSRPAPWLEWLWLLWAPAPLAACALGCRRRLMVTLRGEGNGWLFLVAGAALCLWLCRGDGRVLRRSARVLFFLTAWVLITVPALALPSLRWEELLPRGSPQPAALLRAVLLSLGLAGYGAYVFCLPGGEKKGGGNWAAAGWATAAGLQMALIASFGGVLPAGYPQPILLLLEGVGVPGLFRHGEAALEAGAALADLTLMAVLTWGIRALSRRRLPDLPGWTWMPMAAAAILAPGLFPERWQTVLSEAVAPAGNFVVGVLLPGLHILWRKTGYQCNILGQN